MTVEVSSYPGCLPRKATTIWTVIDLEMETFLTPRENAVGGVVGGGAGQALDHLQGMEDSDDDEVEQDEEPADDIGDELRRYKQASKIALTACPLGWWSNNFHRVFFALPSRHPSYLRSFEGVFSVGRVIQKRRNHLSGSTAEDLIFLHETWDKLSRYTL